MRTQASASQPRGPTATAYQLRMAELLQMAGTNKEVTEADVSNKVQKLIEVVPNTERERALEVLQDNYYDLQAAMTQLLSDSNAPQSVHPIPDTGHPALHTRHRTLHTRRPTPDTRHPPEVKEVHPSARQRLPLKEFRA